MPVSTVFTLERLTILHGRPIIQRLMLTGAFGSPIRKEGVTGGVVRPRRPWVAAIAALTICALGLPSAWLPHSVAASDSPPAPSTASPAEGGQQWLVDDQGKQYRLERIDKKQPHARLGGNRLRLLFGRAVEIVAEDERSFTVKLYRVTESPEIPATHKR